MRICLIPMKPLARAKARLSGVLDPDGRRALALAMLADVVRAARTLDQVWVVHSDDAAEEVARAEGAVPVPDPTPDAGQNPSLEAATAQAIAAGADGVLIVSSDCPAVTAREIDAIARGPGVALAPDRSGDGTNAVWRAPGDAIPLAFGEASRRAHEELARRRSIPFRVVRSSGLSFDVDRPEDLRAAWDTPIGSATREALRALGVSSPESQVRRAHDYPHAPEV